MTNDIAYLEQLSRHRTHLPLYDLVPTTDNAWVAPNATLVGEVYVSKFATVWYNAVIRGEVNAVR
jgi:carbonic anhydrase/acetyltransferase-like protein (isoleucine patch superfamily)